jgi:hypothetical protein
MNPSALLAEADLDLNVSLNSTVTLKQDEKDQI